MLTKEEVTNDASSENMQSVGEVYNAPIPGFVAPLPTITLFEALRIDRTADVGVEEVDGDAACGGAKKEAGFDETIGKTCSRPTLGSGPKPYGAITIGDVRSNASDPSGRYRIFVDNDVDYEAERLSLCAHAMRVLETHGDAPPESPPATARSTGVPKTLQRGATANSMARRILPLLEPLPPPLPGFTLAKYVLDFGNVIKGMQRKKIFRLKNIGWQAVSLDIDKNVLTGLGLRVEPDKVLLRHHQTQQGHGHES